MNPYILLVPILLPILGGILLPLFHFKSRRFRELYVEAVVIANSILVFYLIFTGGAGELTLIRFTQGLSVSFRLDGLGSVFAALVAGLWPFATLYAFEYMRHEGRENYFFTFFTMTFGVTIGIAFASNLMTMYMFYEFLTLITVPLVMHSMDHKAIRAGIKYLKYSIGGAAFAFVGFIILNVYGTSTDFILGGSLDIAKIGDKTNMVLAGYLFMFFGFGVKAAIFPFHGWLPSASVAPTPVTALLHAVAVVKAGVFAIMRVTFFSFGTDFLSGTAVQYIAMGAALLTILYGSSMAVKEQHIKRRMAYSTISNLSYILFGVTLMTPMGLVGGLTHMVFHGLMKITLFFCAGAIMHQTKKEYLYEIDGLGIRMNKIFTCLTIAAAALVGVPPLTGFLSKFKLATAAVDAGSASSGIGAVLPYAGIGVLLLSSLLTAVYLFTIVVRGYFGRKDEAADGTGGSTVLRPKSLDPNWYMLAPIAIFVIAIVALGTCSLPVTGYFADIAAGLK